MTLAPLLVLAALAGAAAPEPPKLLVLVVVDQLRAETLDRSESFPDGFGRLLREGAHFARARHPHVPTETAPGHAALVTGCTPAQHGILGNSWFERSLGLRVGAVQDEEWGKSPRRLRCRGLADALKTHSPRSLVVSISGKDRAAVLMGGGRPDLALWYENGLYTTSEFYGPTPDWVWEFSAGLRLGMKERSALKLTPRFDAITLALAREAIARLGLGAEERTDLLLLSLSGTDYVGHEFGPDGPEMAAQLGSLDKELGAFFEHLDARLGRGRWLAALASDHGVAALPESAQGKAANVRRFSPKALQDALDAELRASGAGELVELALPHLYLKGGEPAKRAAIAFLSRHPSIAEVIDPAVGARPRWDAVFRVSHRADRGGDLMLLMKPGVLLTDRPAGTGHNQPYDYDAMTPFALMGPGVRPGRHEGEIRSIDVAPTLARLLGVDLPPRSGRVLVEALDCARASCPEQSTAQP